MPIEYNSINEVLEVTSGTINGSGYPLINLAIKYKTRGVVQEYIQGVKPEDAYKIVNELRIRRLIEQHKFDELKKSIDAIALQINSSPYSKY